ncbi:MAG: [NiFe]-hydrogenase assembly chaperone HybE [Thalassolituus sp.]
MLSRPTRTAADCQRLLTETFDQIMRTRMSGIPVVNPALTVSAANMTEWHDDIIGVLITPWFMNLMLLPATKKRADEFASYKVGSKHTLSFPSGSYEFTLGGEDRIGHYLSCSLFSPMFDFADQQTAEDTASAVFAGLMNSDNREILEAEPLTQADEPAKSETNDEQAATSAETTTDEPQHQEAQVYSRRQLLRGLRG